MKRCIMPQVRPIIKATLVIVITLALNGCELPYYWQAMKGQYQLLQARQPVASVIADPDIRPALKKTLQDILAAREFALAMLALEDNDSYLTYVELDQDYITWNVFATPKLSMNNRSWCYPIAGCVSYRGYFAKADAEAFAHQLSHEGLDTYVGGASAYSTLGWFDDPILSSFITENPLANAALLFHELAHQYLYIQDDSTFNESFATSVEQILLERWVELQDLESLWTPYQRSVQRHRAFMAMVVDNKNARETLFESDQTELQKSLGKTQLIEQLRLDYQSFKEQWNGYSGYDQWMSRSLNNAQISTVATYYEWVPAFRQLYTTNNEDFERFLRACQEISELETDQRTQKLNQLASQEH